MVMYLPTSPALKSIHAQPTVSISNVLVVASLCASVPIKHTTAAWATGEDSACRGRSAVFSPHAPHHVVCVRRPRTPAKPPVPPSHSQFIEDDQTILWVRQPACYAMTALPRPDSKKYQILEASFDSLYDMITYRDSLVNILLTRVAMWVWRSISRI